MVSGGHTMGCFVIEYMCVCMFVCLYVCVYVYCLISILPMLIIEAIRANGYPVFLRRCVSIALLF